MSAYICSDRHIATIATYYVSLLGAGDAQEIADALLACNIASVNYYYDQATPIKPCCLDAVAPELSFPDLVALCECLDYQSCELPDYTHPLLEAITAQFRVNCRHNVKSALWSI
ncbi:MAG: hypothetical protein IPP59_02380 [Betaproteobacteria bacterium]|nr:hypothetical protein [Betaproteobacteria bacterium]MBK8318372.1 hypothetical protein [Betaproteobacteria bacterium]MBK9783136.1 hypothetical protein [Candidatus Dechloromonas phosphorivorans]